MLNQNFKNTITVPMSEVCAFSINSVVKNLDMYKKIFCDLLKFNVIYDNGSKLVIHNRSFSKDLFLVFEKMNSQKGEAVRLDSDNLVVFYLADEQIFKSMCDLLLQNEVKKVKAFNPYWDENGQTFLISEEENFRIVMCPCKYKSSVNGMSYNARVAIPTNFFDEIPFHFITQLGMKKIGSFSRHNGFDGILFTSDVKKDCHFEFTRYYAGEHKLQKSSQYSISFIFSNFSIGNISFDIVTDENIIFSQDKKGEPSRAIVEYIYKSYVSE